mgnify:FL=1|tara:strand:+ start:642 stop:1559 length:918 start_codon:yes stop_codon:yes gene_type:complete
MNVLWIKDNKTGHEKQVKVLLDELSKDIELDIDERIVKGRFPFFRTINQVEKNYYDIIIGAGHKTYSLLLDVKKYQKDDCKTIAVLSPTFKKDYFDIICAPLHDKNKFKSSNNVIFFEGSLAKVSTNEPSKDITMIAVGGTNKHYRFDKDHLIYQISFLINLYSNNDIYIFNSRRTPDSFNKELDKITKDNANITFANINNNQSISIDEVLQKASTKLISRDSINMVYESLSSKGDTYLLDMKDFKSNNKVVKNVNHLIANRKIGYVDTSDIINGISKIKLEKQNSYNDVYAEVEKVAFEIRKYL